MPFDLYAPLFDAEGRASRKVVDAWNEELVRLFVASPEAAAVAADGGWLEIVLELALADREALAGEIEVADLEAVLYTSFPLKVVCLPADVPGLVAELSAFFGFLERAWSHAPARACRDALADPAPARLAQMLGDPRLFGAGKAVLVRISGDEG
jgi:hypothetical protein